jgi:adenylate cyclase
MKRNFFRLRVFYGIILINSIFVIASGSIIISSMWINSEKNARELSMALIEEIGNSIANRTVNYFAQAKSANQSLIFLLYRFFEDPFNNTAHREMLFGYYADVLKAHSQFKTIYFADTVGNMVMLNRMRDGSFSKRGVFNTGEEIHTQWDHVNPAYYGSYFNTSEPAATGYDPRKRPWYPAAVQERNAIWTPVYIFATDHLPGFTCAVPVFDSAGKLIGVSSIDIAVDELSRFLGGIRPTSGTMIFIQDKHENLVALQAEEEKDLERLFVQSLDDSGSTAYNVSSISAFKNDAIRYLLQKALESGSQFELIKYRNQNYMSSLIPITIGDGLELFINIFVPEDDIVGGVRRNMKNVTIFSVIILIIALIVSAFFSQAIAKPMRTLSEQMSRIKSFDLDSQEAIRTNLVEIGEMQDSFENMRSGLKSFKRYVPADLVAQLINQSITADLGGEQRELTVFFSDIAKFTSIAEKMNPDRLVLDLCVYFETISKTISENKGTIDKYIGDSVMAFWGAPVPMEDHAEKACRSAIMIRDNLHTLFRQWENQGKYPFSTRIGIHTGKVIVGNMGYHERLNYTVIGDAVNVSSRLEGINKIYGSDIVISEDTYVQCRNSFEFRLLDRVSVLGREKGMHIYELITFKDDIDKTLKKIFQYYENGLRYYFDRNWNEALKYFTFVLKNRPNDTPARLMWERCLLYQKNPPHESWNGVFVQSYK